MTMMKLFGHLPSVLFRLLNGSERYAPGYRSPGNTLSAEASVGRVYIVGAGPGDAELLTVKAVRLLQQADIVMFDWLVDESVLALIPRHVVKEFVGKRSGQHSVAQEKICERLVELAEQGKTVVRLKGGDAAVFARTCEETDALTAADIPFAIVPGITAASGASAYTGIPLTDRRCAQSVTLMTAHLQNAKLEPDWQAISATVEKQTLVLYMGFKRLPLIVSRLQSHNVSSQLPIAVIENACCPSQRMFTGTLGSIVNDIADKKISGPTLLILGHVVNSRQRVTPSLLQESLHVEGI